MRSATSFAERILQRLHNGVYLIASAPLTFEARCAAACLADSEAVVTGPAAARLWEFRHVFRPSVPEVLVRHDRTPITSGVVLRRTNVLSAEDVVERADGIRVASPPRAWFDCASHLDDARFEMLTEWVLDHHVGISVLFHTVRRLEARGRPGLARVHRVLSQRPAWQKPAQSGLETRVLRALRRGGVTRLANQHPIRLPNGVVIHADVADPSIGWAVEIDHVTWHGGRFEAQRDKARDRQARKAGWLDRARQRSGTARHVSRRDRRSDRQPPAARGRTSRLNLRSRDVPQRTAPELFTRTTGWVVVGCGAGQSPAGGLGSLGSPSTRSPTMLRWIWLVPPQIVSDREKKNADIIGLTG